MPSLHSHRPTIVGLLVPGMPHEPMMHPHVSCYLFRPSVLLVLLVPLTSDLRLNSRRVLG